MSDCVQKFELHAVNGRTYMCKVLSKKDMSSKAYLFLLDKITKGESIQTIDLSGKSKIDVCHVFGKHVVSMNIHSIETVNNENERSAVGIIHYNI